MKRIERFNIIDRVARELQARMSYQDIEAYLKGFGIKPPNSEEVGGGWNSKWVYAKHFLNGAPDGVVVNVANELGIPHDISPSQGQRESKYWLEGHFRLFLSHVSVVKDRAANLRDVLKGVGISSFVAHSDIEPTAEWQDEIENALYSMDALAAIITPEFRMSAWCDQEVGVAFGRGALIVPIMRGAEPHGFIGKYQGINTAGKKTGQVAESLFRVLSANAKTKAPLTNALVHQFLFATDEKAALKFLSLLRRTGKPPENVLEKLRENVRSRPLLMQSGKVLEELNQLLKEYGLEDVDPKKVEFDFEDDIPF